MQTFLQIKTRIYNEFELKNNHVVYVKKINGFQWNKVVLFWSFSVGIL